MFVLTFNDDEFEAPAVAMISHRQWSPAIRAVAGHEVDAAPPSFERRLSPLALWRCSKQMYSMRFTLISPLTPPPMAAWQNNNCTPVLATAQGWSLCTIDTNTQCQHLIGMCSIDGCAQ
jgi:hypothetical protein